MLRKGQLKTLDEARVTPEQHKNPCVDCPFGRIAVPGWLAGETPDRWLQMAHSETKFECHTLLPHQCAGSAIYRANVCKTPRDPQILQLRSNRKLVFSTPQEFLKHHQRGRK